MYSLKTVILTAILFFIITNSYSADRYWVGGAGTWDAATTTNWSATTGGAGGASVPSAADNVYIDANSGGGSVTLSTSPSIVNLTIATGQTLACSSYTLSASGTATITGTITISTGTIDVDGTFDATGGTITFSGAGNFLLGGAVTSLGTFTASTSTVVYNMAGAQNIAAVNYYNLQTSNSGTKSITGTIDIGGTGGDGILTVDNGTTLAIGNFTVTHNVVDATNDALVNTIAGTVTLGNGTWTATYGAQGAISTTGTITVTGTGVIYVRGGGSQDIAPFNCGTGTVYYSRNGNQTIAANTFYDLIIDGTSGTKTLSGAITVSNDLTLTSNGGGALDVSASNYTITCTGNWINNGSFNAQAGRVTFNGAANKSISGSTNTSFYELEINKGTDITSILDVTVATTITYNVVFTAGLLRLTHASAVVSNDVTSATTDIQSTAGLHLNGGSYTTTSNNVFNNSGYVRITSGTATIGTASDNTMYNESATSVFILDGGTINCKGRFRSASGSTTISSGTLTSNIAGGESIATRGSFEIATGSDFSMSGGTVIIEDANPHASGNDVFIVSGGTKTITGGTIQLGNASTAAGQSFRINSDLSLYNLTINTTNTPTATLQQNTTIQNNFTNSGTLDTKSGSNYSLTIGGNYTNNGTFTARSGTVTFNGGAAQSLGGTASTSFYNLTMNNTSATGVLLGVNTTITNQLTLTDGLLYTVSFTLTLGTNAANATVPAGSSASNIVAYDNGGTIGYVKQFINSAAATTYNFPIGEAATNFTPYQLTLQTVGSLTNAYITIYTKNTAIPGMDPTITQYIARHWILSESGITSPNYDVSYTYLDGDIVGGVEAGMKPIKLSSTGWDWYKPVGTSFTNGIAQGTGSVNTGSNTLTWTGLTTFSKFGGAVDAVVPLPVTLYNFSVINYQEKVKLNWKTANEINNDYFIIERSDDGKKFQFVNQIKGAGNSNSPISYFTIDENFYKGINYYRLKMIDFNLVETESPILSLDMSESLDLIIMTVNSLGQEVKPDYHGLVFDIYSNGNSVKRIQ